MTRQTMLTRNTIGLFLLVFVTLNSCSKGSSNNSAASSASLLASGNWKLSKYEYMKKDGTWVPDPNPTGVIPIMLTFSSANTFSELYNANYGSSGAGTWSLSADNAQLTIVGGFFVAGIYQVNALDASSLVITNPNYTLSSVYVGQRTTFSH